MFRSSLGKPSLEITVLKSRVDYVKDSYTMKEHALVLISNSEKVSVVSIQAVPMAMANRNVHAAGYCIQTDELGELLLWERGGIERHAKTLLRMHGYGNISLIFARNNGFSDEDVAEQVLQTYKRELMGQDREAFCERSIEAHRRIFPLYSFRGIVNRLFGVDHTFIFGEDSVRNRLLASNCPNRNWSSFSPSSYARSTDPLEEIAAHTASNSKALVSYEVTSPTYTLHAESVGGKVVALETRG